MSQPISVQDIYTEKVDSHIVLRHNVPRPIVPLRYFYNKDK